MSDNDHHAQFRHNMTLFLSKRVAHSNNGLNLTAKVLNAHSAYAFTRKGNTQIGNLQNSQSIH